jgi:hypothetical protein
MVILQMGRLGGRFWVRNDHLLYPSCKDAKSDARQ